VRVVLNVEGAGDGAEEGESVERGLVAGGERGGCDVVIAVGKDARCECDGMYRMRYRRSSGVVVVVCSRWVVLLTEYGSGIELISGMWRDPGFRAWWGKAEDQGRVRLRRGGSG
jgi:hypothetical protein